jgi:1-acyl-sn-glycerol-3-phosphate acyltransferase
MRGTAGEFREAELRFIKIAGAALIPIVIRGAEKVFPEGALISPGRVEILIEPGIPVNDLDDLKAVMHKLQQSYKGAKE